MSKRQKSRAGRANKASENFRTAVRTGLHLGKMTGNWAKLTLEQADMARDWQQGFSRFATVATGMLSATQKQAGELVALMGHSIQAKAGLMDQALGATQAPSLFGSQARWMEFWMDALRLAQTNAATVTQINSRAVSAWFRLVGGYNGNGKA